MHRRTARRPFAERHDEWAIALVRRGSFLYRAHDSRRPHALREGWLLLGRHGAEYECSHDHAGGDDCTVLFVDAALLEDVARGCGARTMLPGPVAPPLTAVAAQMGRAWRAWEDGRPFDLDALAVDVASSILRSFGARAFDVPVRAGELDRTRAALELLDARCEEPWSLSEVAEHVGLSALHFARLFRRVVGTTPHQCLIDARLRRASQLLLDTARPVIEIALDVGFDDLSNFMRTFHRRIGAAPSAFPRLSRGEDRRTLPPA